MCAVKVGHATVGAIIKLVGAAGKAIHSISGAGAPARGIIDRLRKSISSQELQTSGKALGQTHLY